mmetsp:Transcript_22190/g.46699  ORF Transcript_22190/g.46699 Transcript_22190/m.46699 type:complete len:191 (-) Transcript_22190:1471-2043(-)
MKAIEGSTRIMFLGYFLSHVPITMLVDAQGLFGLYYPKALTDVVAWYSDLFGDALMKNAPSVDIAWFSCLIFCEVLFQLPFFFVAIKFIMAGGSNHKNDASMSQSQQYPEWFRMACVIYGSHVSTTLVPIIGTFITSEEMTIKQKCATTAIYSPYFIFPFWLMLLAVREDFVKASDTRRETNLKRETKLD